MLKNNIKNNIKNKLKERTVIMATILITGANKGIGLELAIRYAKSGNNVFACCRNPDNADELNILAEQYDLTVVAVSVGDDSSVNAMAEKLQDTPIDILINNAGTIGPKPEQQTAYVMDFDGWADTMNINALAPVRVMHALMTNLRAGSNRKVVTISSQLGAISVDMPMNYAYSASKAAINKYMKLAAIELAKENINVGLIHPGWVQTSMGGPGADITPQESAVGIINVIDKLNAENNGGFWNWNGEVHAW
jgi:NAD(P)-dependent dehydrogenase (short-subunit alcohol dehydrogenase family)